MAIEKAELTSEKPGVDLIVKPDDSRIECMIMAIMTPIIIPALMAGLLLPQFIGPDSSLYHTIMSVLVTLVVMGVSLPIVVTRGKPLVRFNSTLRLYHSDDRRVPKDLAYSYRSVQELPSLLDSANASIDAVSTANLMAERADELASVLSSLLASSKDEDWVLRQDPAIELLQLGSQARSVKDQVQNLRHAHVLTPDSPLSSLSGPAMAEASFELEEQSKEIKIKLDS